MIVSPGDTSLMECVSWDISCVTANAPDSLMRRQSDQQIYTTFVGVGTHVVTHRAPHVTQAPHSTWS